MRKSQYSQPYFVGGFKEDDTALALSRIHLARNLNDVESQEFRLQSFIMRYPSVLPIGEIEQSFVPAVPVCMELPTKSNFYLDNLFVTPSGDLILVECKLWKNYEARRQVIAQLLEYAKEISTWHYSDLEAAIRKSSFRHLKPGETPARNLYDFVKDTPDVLDEKNFVDQVSRGLKRGRFLLLIVGDGIHEGLETLVEYVQLHGGMHFTIGLIDIAIFKGPTSGFLVLPRIVARTTNIDRGIVSIRDGEIIVEPPARSSDTSASPGRRTTITEDKFYEALAMANPLLPASLRSFMKELDDELHVETDFGQSSLVLRWRAGGDAKWNLGSVTTVGKLWTDMVDWQAKQIGRPDLSQRYHERLCSIVPGGRIKKYKSSQQVVTPDGLPDVYDLLRDIDKRRKWSAAIEEFIDDVNRNTEQT